MKFIFYSISNLYHLSFISGLGLIIFLVNVAVKRCVWAVHNEIYITGHNFLNLQGVLI